MLALARSGNALGNQGRARSSHPPVPSSDFLSNAFELRPIACPQYSWRDADLAQRRRYTRVALLIFCDFRLPEVSVARRPAPAWAVVPMPEAAVHEKCEPQPRDVNVRAPRKVPAVQPVAYSSREQEATKGNLGLGVTRAHSGHLIGFARCRTTTASRTEAAASHRTLRFHVVLRLNS